MPAHGRGSRALPFVVTLRFAPKGFPAETFLLSDHKHLSAALALAARAQLEWTRLVREQWYSPLRWYVTDRRDGSEHHPNIFTGKEHHAQGQKRHDGTLW